MSFAKCFLNCQNCQMAHRSRQVQIGPFFVLIFINISSAERQWPRYVFQSGLRRLVVFLLNLLGCCCAWLLLITGTCRTIQSGNSASVMYSILNTKWGATGATLLRGMPGTRFHSKFDTRFGRMVELTKN